jgi:hypothetical protein
MGPYPRRLLSSSPLCCLKDALVWKEAVVPYFKVLSQHLPGGTEKITKALSQEKSLDLDLNPGRQEYEAAVVITRPRRSVKWCFSSKFPA